MKKSLLLSSILSLALAGAHAQSSKFGTPDDMPTIPGTENPSGKATAVASRMIGSSHNLYNVGTSSYVLSDSFVYAYSGDRGGDNNTQYYDTRIASYLTGGVVVPSSRTLITYLPSPGSTASSMSISQQWDAATSTWVNSAKNLFFHNSAEKVIQDSSFSWDKPTSSWVKAGAGTYNRRPSGKYNYNYYMQFNKATSSWDTTSLNIYTLDASDNYTDWVMRTRSGGVLKNYSRTLYTYNAAGVATSIISQKWGTAWTNSAKSDYEINAHGDREKTYSLNWNSATSTWDSLAIYIDTYDPSFFMVSSITKVYNKSTLSFENRDEYVYTKNSYNQRTSTVTRTWNVGGFWEKATGDYKDNFWYEEYTTSSIGGVNAKEGNIKIYPVPAQSELTVEINAENNKLFDITVLDMLGRAVMLQSNTAAQNNIMHVDVSPLPAGSYTLVMHNQLGEKYSSKFSIAR